ncbi:hypothetical protein KFL_011930010, partial [Klebsormidium nitens]
PHSLLCDECTFPATFAVRGGKEGGNLKCFCGVHRLFIPGCFKVETARAEWARDCEVFKVKKELARALDEEARLKGNRGCKGCNDWQQNECWWDPTPKSRDLIGVSRGRTAEEEGEEETRQGSLSLGAKPLQTFAQAA